MGKSVFGPGMKAGGPNYVAQFMEFAAVDSCQLSVSANDNSQLTTDDRQLTTALRSRSSELGDDGDEQAARILAAVLSYERHQREEFSVPHDHFRLVGQDNFRRYLPVRRCASASIRRIRPSSCSPACVRPTWWGAASR